MQIFGRKDTPLEQRDQDSLDIQPYADGLRDFVRSCETPMTVGLQGEWGSGKTSLMKLVKNGLEGAADPSRSPVRTFWFETWQYGAMGNAEALGMLLMRDLTARLMSELQDDDDRAYRTKEKMRTALKAAFPALVGAAASAITRSEALGDAVTRGVESINGGKPDGRSNMRTCFENLVAEALRGHPKEDQPRVIVFIDDLDRVRPGLAVRLLEVLKNFMDVTNCVFVVACDYEVVREGVQELMGIRAQSPQRRSEKVDAFFHKLFQVQFLMPVGSYQIQKLFEAYIRAQLFKNNQGRLDASRQTDKNMVNNFLATGRAYGRRGKKTGSFAAAPVNAVGFESGTTVSTAHWSADLQEVIRIAVGTNPRALKRFLNLIDLTCCVDSAMATGENSGTTPQKDSAPVGTQESLAHWSLGDAKSDLRTIRWCTALFPIVALQQRWPEIASYLLADASVQTRLETDGPDREFTEFERKLRTIAGNWPDPPEDAEDDHVQSNYADELMVQFLTEHYGASDEEGARSSRLSALREFALRWFNLLNNSNAARDFLTVGELDVIAKWSRNLGSMGAMRIQAKGIAKLRLSCLEISNVAGDGFAALASYAQSRAGAEDLPYLDRDVSDSQVRVLMSAPKRQRAQLIRFSMPRRTLEVRVNATVTSAGKNGLPALEQIGAVLRRDLVDVVGLKPGAIKEHSVSFFFDFKPGHSSKRMQNLRQVFGTFMEAVDQAISDQLATAQMNPGPTATAATTTAMSDSEIPLPVES